MKNEILFIKRMNSHRQNKQYSLLKTDFIMLRTGQTDTAQDLTEPLQYPLFYRQMLLGKSTFSVTLNRSGGKKGSRKLIMREYFFYVTSFLKR